MFLVSHSSVGSVKRKLFRGGSVRCRLDSCNTTCESWISSD